MITPTKEDGHSPRSVTVGTKFTEILSINEIRQNAMITNNSHVTCYIGLSEGLTVANGIPMEKGDVFIIDKDNPYTGRIYGITSSSEADLRVLEVSKLSVKS